MSIFNDPNEKVTMAKQRLIKVLIPILGAKRAVDGAMVLQQIYYWCKVNEEQNRNYYDGRYWTFSAYNEWIARDFIWMSKSTLYRLLKDLGKANLIFTSDKYNKRAYDQTKWYSVNEDEVELLLEEPEPAEAETELEIARTEIATTIEEYTPSQNDEGASQNEQGYPHDEAQNDDISPIGVVNLNRGLVKMNRGASQNDEGGYSKRLGGLVKMNKPIPEITKKILKKEKKEIKSNTFAQKPKTADIQPKNADYQETAEKEPKTADIQLSVNQGPKTFTREDSKAMRDLLASRPQTSYSKPPMEASREFWAKR